jgi:hypothetical protein
MLIAAGCDGQDQPTRISFDDETGTMSVEFPGEPRRETHPETNDSQSAVSYGFIGRLGEYDFWQLQQGMHDASVMLSLYRSAVLSSYENFTLVGEQSMTIDTFPGIAIEFTYDHAGRRRHEELRYYVVGTYTYIVGYSALEDAYDSVEAARFFAGLRYAPR